MLTAFSNTTVTLTLQFWKKAFSVAICNLNCQRISIRAPVRLFVVDFSLILCWFFVFHFFHFFHSLSYEQAHLHQTQRFRSMSQVYSKCFHRFRSTCFVVVEQNSFFFLVWKISSFFFLFSKTMILFFCCMIVCLLFESLLLCFENCDSPSVWFGVCVTLTFCCRIGAWSRATIDSSFRCWPTMWRRARFSAPLCRMRATGCFVFSAAFYTKQKLQKYRGTCMCARACVCLSMCAVFTVFAFFFLTKIQNKRWHVVTHAITYCNVVTIVIC